MRRRVPYLTRLFPEIRAPWLRQSLSRDMDLLPRLRLFVPSADRVRCPPWAQTPTSRPKQCFLLRRLAPLAQSTVDRNFRHSRAEPETLYEIRESRHNRESKESSGASLRQPRVVPRSPA